MMIRIAVFLLAIAFSAKAELLAQPRAYPSGFSVVLKLASELCEALPDCYCKQLNGQSVAIQPQQFPVIGPVTTTEDTRATRQVCLSAGFIDMVNHICHAKAIDRIEPGYFDQYVKNLAQLTANDPSAPPPNIVSARYWKDDVMNDQLSYFNQVIGFVTALNLSHHYLGHYAKYASNIAGPGQMAAPINKFLTTNEWEGSVRAGAVDALNCALATDGPRALFDAIDRMPQRPVWAAYIVPQQVDIKTLNNQLIAYETSFFRGGLR